jgi:Peptidase family C25/Propeptide_C25/Peptidase family C25, C terminal ig-like domain/Secretion system C-terminal sorting domain
MKSLYSFVFCALLTHGALSQTNIHVVAQEGSSVMLSCTVSNYSVTHDGIYTDIDFKESTPLLNAGAPQVRKLTEALIVDDTQEMMISVTHSVYEEFQDVYMRPSKGNLLRTIDPATVPFQEGAVYAQNEFYPGNLASLGDPFVQHQFRGQSIHFYPVQYNPVTHVLRVYSSIDVTVASTGQPGENPLPANVSERTQLPMQEVYKAHFLNYTENSSRYDQVSELGNMLVITHAQYLEELEPWIQWKKEKGIPVEVVDVATINSVAAIQTYVQNYYDTNRLTYLMLVGDENQVPVELINNSGGQGYCDACYGYVSGNDSYADVFVGHFLVHNDAELPALVQKTLEYERNPNTSIDWFSVAMGIGSNEGDGIGDDNQADWAHQNGIKEDLLGFTYTEVWEKYDGGHTASSPSGGLTADGSGSPSAASLTDVIESGCSLINYTGHGAHTLIVTGSYTNTQINALQNNGYYPYFIVVGCCTGDYDDDDATGETFGEAWIKSPSASNLTGGLGGAFSSVYQSWAPPMEAQDEMNKIIAETAGIETRHTIGSIHYHGCASMNDAYGAGGDEMTDTWIVMADPTIQLRTAMPSQLVATHPAGAVLGITSMTIYCATEDAMICASFNGEILDAQVINGGQVTLNFAAVVEPGDILITATSFNTIPYQALVPVTPADGPYVVGNATGINDATGNGNGLADYNEQIGLNINAENIGIEAANDVNAVATCANNAVVMDNNTQNFGNLAAGSSVEVNSAFSFHIEGYIADQTVVTFVVTYTDGLGNTWSSNIPVTIQAPQFDCTGAYTLDDSQGNGNGRIDAGEIVYITFPVTNSGHAATAVSVTAALSQTLPGVAIGMTPEVLGIIQPGQTVNAEFYIQVDGNITEAVAIALSLEITSDYYGNDCGESITANQSMEDWETGDDSSYNWTYSGNADWFVTSAQAYEGTYSMQSGDINDNQLTTMYLVVNAPAQFDLLFSFKTSTEDGYDFLSFLVDNVEQDTWSGENDWTEVSYILSPGSHNVRWKYAKDFTVSAGSDACWVDNIVLPVAPSVSVTEATCNAYVISAYPVPFANSLTVRMNSMRAAQASIRVLNSIGSVVEERLVNVASGTNTWIMDAQNWASGLYTIQFITGEGIESLPVVKQ